MDLAWQTSHVEYRTNGYRTIRGYANSWIASLRTRPRMPPAVAAIHIKYKSRTGRTGQSMNYGSLGCWVGMSHVMVRHCLPSTSLSPDTSQPNSRGLGRGLRQVSF